MKTRPNLRRILKSEPWRHAAKTLVAATFFLAIIPGIVDGQSDSKRRAWGYGFLAPGGSAGDGSAFTIHYGGGADVLLYKGVGLGAELGNVHAIGYGNTGIVSANGSYTFRRKEAMAPFVTGGLSRKFADDLHSANGVNLGVGVQCWSSHRVGLRVEFRDHHFSKGVLNFYGVRLGVAFR